MKRTPRINLLLHSQKLVRQSQHAFVKAMIKDFESSTRMERNDKLTILTFLNENNVAKVSPLIGKCSKDDVQYIANLYLYRCLTDLKSGSKINQETVDFMARFIRNERGYTALSRELSETARAFAKTLNGNKDAQEAAKIISRAFKVDGHALRPKHGSSATTPRLKPA
jgi:hypothetical protein